MGKRQELTLAAACQDIPGDLTFLATGVRVEGIEAGATKPVTGVWHDSKVSSGASS